jgi:hypothetical protein
MKALLAHLLGEQEGRALCQHRAVGRIHVGLHGVNAGGCFGRGRPVLVKSLDTALDTEHRVRLPSIYALSGVRF